MNRSICSAAAILLLAGCSQAPVAVETGSKPQIVGTIHDLMEDIIEPSANALWEATAINVDKTGTHSDPPETDEEWARLRSAALLLAESPNLIVLEGRKVLPPGVALEAGGTLNLAGIEARLRERPAALASHAARLQVVARKALTAVDARDLKALDQIGGDIDDACEACHEEFWYPPAQPKKP